MIDCDHTGKQVISEAIKPEPEPEPVIPPDIFNQWRKQLNKPEPEKELQSDSR